MARVHATGRAHVRVVAPVPWFPFENPRFGVYAAFAATPEHEIRKGVMIDHRGAVTHLLPRLTMGRLEATVQGRDGLTPYAQWAGVHGLWPAWALCGAIALLAMLAKLVRHTIAAPKPRRR